MKIKKSDLLIIIFVIGSLLVTGANYLYHTDMRDSIKSEQEVYNKAYDYIIENCNNRGYYNIKAPEWLITGNKSNYTYN